MKLSTTSVSPETDKILCEILCSGKKSLRPYKRKHDITFNESSKNIALRLQILKKARRNTPELFIEHCLRYGLDPPIILYQKENIGLSPTRVTTTTTSTLPVPPSDPVPTDDSIFPSLMDTSSSDMQTTPFAMNLFNAANAAAKEMKLLKEKNEKLAQKLIQVEEEHANDMLEISIWKEENEKLEQARKEAEIEGSKWQAQFLESKANNDQLTSNLYQTRQDLRNAREDRDEVQEELQDLRVQVHNQKAELQDERSRWFSLIKKEKARAKEGKAELQQSIRALEEHIAVIAAVVKREPPAMVKKEIF